MNFTVDALSRVQINNVEYFQNSLDYEKMALSQTTDAVIQDLLQNNVTSLQLEQFALSRTSPSLIWCDVSTGAIRSAVPDSFRQNVFHKLHSLSHLGIKSTIQLITQRFVWPNVKKDIRAWVRECNVCQASKIHLHNFSEFKPYAVPTARFQEINMDIVCPLPPSNSNGYKYLLTAIDRFTRFLTAVPMRDCTAQSVVDAFLHGYVAYFGVPKVIITDSGAQFDSFLFTGLLQFLGCQRHRTTSYHPRSNGLVENAQRRLKAALRMQASPDRWFHNLPLVLLSIRIIIKDEIDFAPTDLVFGQQLALPGEFNPPLVSSNNYQGDFVRNMHEHFQHIHPSPAQITSHLKHYVDKNLPTCTYVWLRNDSTKSSLQAKYTGPYHVVKRTDKVFTIEMKDSLKQVSIDRLEVAHLPVSTNSSADVHSLSFLRLSLLAVVELLGDPLDFLIDCLLFLGI